MTRLHWLGAALVFLGSTAAGFALRQELRLRLRLLTAVIDSLNLLRSDIVGRRCRCRRRAPSGGGCAEPLSTQYAALADGITDGGRPFSESWAAAFQALDMLTPDVRAALLTLGEQLGKYDAQIQRPRAGHLHRDAAGCCGADAGGHDTARKTLLRPRRDAWSARRRGSVLITQEALMDVDLVFKIAAIGILVAVLNILLSRAGRDEQALMTTIAGLVVVLVLVIQKISELFDLIKSLFSL